MKSSKGITRQLIVRVSVPEHAAIRAAVKRRQESVQAVARRLLCAYARSVVAREKAIATTSASNTTTTQEDTP
jgi:hypothetical protein